ncbi:MAG TPA: glycine betaine ABC transporter substrate-binding protein [Burkholderiales bacterium]|nr:glycine betaine ABC transporter substrate-binding protein [Burkholderiales bacterium]
MPLLSLLVLTPALALAQPAVDVGSKRFTESYILAEILTRTVERAGEARARHRPGLGNTAIVFAALTGGAIQIYPEYTGTIALELLGRKTVPGLAELNENLSRHGLAAGVRLGFNNSYALAMLESRAEELGIVRITDLARYPRLRVAVSQEFLNRKDGWHALRRSYQLRSADVRGLDHGIAYEALAGGQADIIDVYSTDARLRRYRIRVLQDDRGFFPRYEAVLLYRKEFPERLPRTWQAVQALEGRITQQQMTGMNAAAELSGVAFAQIAEDFLAGRYSSGAPAAPAGGGSFINRLFGADFWRLTAQHLLLVMASLALGVAAGVPLGVWAHRVSRLRAWIMGAAGVLQTVPSLALLAFLIAALDRIGTVPAIVALFLYSLLPIVRNTEAGLAGISRSLRDSATALGLTEWGRLRLIELPLAARTILSGVKTAAVINVGTATIAAFIGAGGYGERIVAGLAVNDHGLLLAGAVPAAVMALLVQGMFDLAERYLAPWSLRPRG